jgi:hypothetical protein
VRSELDAGFLSHVLAGEVGQASTHLPPAIGASLAAAARMSFASGFAAALYVAAAAAGMIALAVWLLAGRAAVHRDGGRTVRAGS